VAVSTPTGPTVLRRTVGPFQSATASLRKLRGGSSRILLVGYRQDVFMAMTALVQHLAAAGSVYATDFDGWLGDAQQRAEAVPECQTS
jgi:hypothetical protein